MKRCSKCKKLKPLTAFQHETGGGGVTRPLARCTRCDMLQRRYRINDAEYDLMVKLQKGKCAICKVKSAKTLHIDHCHETGRIRGLLCGPCNRGLGQLKDDPVLLRAAALYVESR